MRAKIRKTIKETNRREVGRQINLNIFQNVETKNGADHKQFCGERMPAGWQNCDLSKKKSELDVFSRWLH